jgi:peptidyl-prolyl cis-trans isomerase A (cyclophilin A)
MLAIRDVSRWRLLAAASCTALLALAPSEHVVPPKPAPDCIQPAREWSQQPPPVLPSHAVFATAYGKITCTLDWKHAPATVANFMKLAFNGFYNGLTFHRVIPGFMIQGGDPNGNGTGGPGYEFADEIAPDLSFDHPGVLAMANRGKNTNGSQFFITDAEARHLDQTSTIFGTCDHPDVVHAIASVPRASNDRPIEPVVMTVTLE